MNPPGVSVVIPVFNGERYLSDAIQSVLDQRHPSLELIVVDDGSTDGSAAVARSHVGVRLLPEPHRGLPATLNAGLAAATGDLVAFLDADDLWPAGRLEVLLGHLAAHPDVGLVAGRRVNFRGEGPPRPGAAPDVGDRGAFSLGCMVVRAEVFHRIGVFDTRLAHSHDLDWLDRAKAAGVRSALLPEVVLHRRLHETNLSRSDPERRASDYLRAVKLAMDRRRGRGAAVDPKPPA